MSKTNSFRARQEKVFFYLESNEAEAILLGDMEGGRNSSLRYLCGHPGDALLFLFREGKTVLLPWDVPLAEEKASVDAIIPYTDYKRSFQDAACAVITNRGIAGGSKIELSGKLSFPAVRDLAAALPSCRLICEKDGIDAYLGELRSVKDKEEIHYLRQAARITNRIIEGLRALLTEKPGRVTELDLALFIQAQAGAMGAEGLGFETLVASPGRSFAIHAFPSHTSEVFARQGLSILDFGLKYAGYTSDVTVTVIGEPLNGLQESMVQAVEEVYSLALSLIKVGQSPSQIAKTVEEALGERGFTMPHALGHGIGLDAHEGPLFRNEEKPGGKALCAGMVFTIEPGLYHPEAGGVRLENDILLTVNGAEVLTEAQLIRVQR